MSSTLNRETNRKSTGVSTTCTCGHNYANTNHNNEDPSREGGPQQDQYKSSSDRHQEEGIYNTKTALPLDTSFVQIPMIHTIPSNYSSQRTSHDRITRGVASRGTPGSLENENNSQQPCSSNVHYAHCITQLYQAASSETDSVPSLCQNCIQR